MVDLVVVGAGSAGLTAARFGAKAGAQVVLVESARVGGDCTWSGCVPSKALVHVAKVAHEARHGHHVGVHTGPVRVDMAQVQAAVAARIEAVYQHESPEVLEEEGLRVIQGAARFEDPHTLRVGDERIETKAAVLCVGAKARRLRIPGADEVPYHTHETIFENTRLPAHLLVVGSGPVGAELGQAYARLGAKVTIVGPALLAREHEDVRRMMATRFAREGVSFVEGKVASLEGEAQDVTMVLEDGQRVRGDMLLVAIGRAPRGEGLGLEAAKIKAGKKGIEVDQYLRTSCGHVYAAGDCTGSAQFTHLAGWQGYIAARNALFPGKSVGLGKLVPRATFTDPVIASVGMSLTEAREVYGEEALAVTQPLDKVDRAVCEGDTEGLFHLVYHRDGRILGATLMSSRAEEMINQCSLAIEHKLDLRAMATTLHAYPSYGMGLQRLASDLVTELSLQGFATRMVRKAYGYKS